MAWCRTGTGSDNEINKKIWPKGTFKEDAKDKEEVAKEKENVAGGYGVAKDMDQE